MDQDTSISSVKANIPNCEQTPDAAPVVANAVGEELEASHSLDGVAVPSPTNNDPLLLQKISASLADQTSLLKLNFAALGKLSDQVKQQTEETLARIHRPILLELVLFHDNLERAIEWARASSDLAVNDVVGRLEILQIELLEVLSRKDVRRFEEHPISLDSRLHRTIKTQPTADSAENNKVAQIVRAGFFWGEKVLRPEEVVIKKYSSQDSLKGD